MSDSKVLPPGLEQAKAPIPTISPRPDAVRVKRPPRRRRPLPDAQAIAEVSLPEHAPPYDDAPAVRRRSNRPRRLALVDSGPAEERLLPRIGGPDAEPISGTGAWPSRFAQVLAETLAGARPAEQLAPWTTQQARRRINQLGPMLASGPQPRIRRIIVTSPVASVLEMTAIIAVGPDVHAVAVRLERPRSAADSGCSADESSPDGSRAPADAGSTSPAGPGNPARPAGSGTPAGPARSGTPADRASSGTPADRASSSCPAGPAGSSTPAGPVSDAHNLSGTPTALTAAPASIRAARLRASAHWLCTAVEVA